jgi:hypothetical protein
MSLSRPSECRQLPVRLTEIRPEVRWSAARRVAAAEPGWATAVLLAALRPSDTTYYVSAGAWLDLSRMAA